MNSSWKISKSKAVPKKLNNYNVEQKLFEIGSSSFYIGTNTYINEKVLIRIFPKLNLNKELDEISYINNEVFLSKILNHKNILRLFEMVESSDFIFLIYEYFDCELLSDVVKKKKFNEKEIISILFRLITALTYTHQTMKTAHLTLNLNSILIDKNNNIKLFNYRYGCFYTNEINNYNENDDMFLYSSPEIHAKQKFNPESADVYSCGIIVYYLHNGELPFNSDRKILNDQLIMQGEYSLPESTSKKMFEIITSLMENEPKKRKKFKDIINSNWFDDIELKSNDKREIRGLNIFHERYPIDENVMKICNEYKLNKKDLFIQLNNNTFNNITSLYKQIENKLNRKGIKTACDLYSDKFIGYLNNNLNYYESKECKNNQEKIKKDHNQNAEDIMKKITYLKDNQVAVHEGLEVQKQRYKNHDYRTVKKEEPKNLSSRRKSVLYGKKLLNNLRISNNLKNVNNNDPTSFISTNEISVGFAMNGQKGPFKADRKSKYLKCISAKIEEENVNDNKIKGILKKKGKNRRGSSLLLDRNSIKLNEKTLRRSSVLSKSKNFDEYIVNFYQKDNSKKIQKNNEENKSIYSSLSSKLSKSISSRLSKSSKSNLSSITSRSSKSNKTKKTYKSNKTNKTYKTNKTQIKQKKHINQIKLIKHIRQIKHIKQIKQTNQKNQ